MAAVRRLSNPPIAEAVIAISAHLPRPMSDDVNLKEILPQDFREAYPKASKLQEGTVQVQMAPDAAPPLVHRAFGGFRLETNDGKRIATFRNEHFLFSFANGYSSWEEFVAAARIAWGHYRSVAAPALVHRVGLRYINRCKLPVPSDSREYLTAGPRLPEELELDIPSFFSQVGVDVPGAKALVTQFLEHAVGQTNVIIDVDVSQVDLTLDPGSPDIWTKLDTFREWKNKLFFAHVTDKLLEPYL